MRQLVVGLTFFVMGCLMTGQTWAAPIYLTGAGNSVTSANYSATFDSIRAGMSLLGYTEDNLIVSVDDTAYLTFTPGLGFDDYFHYGSAGNFSYVSISTADHQEIFGLEFLLGTGFNNDLPGYMTWEIYDNSNRVASGNSGSIMAGTVVGWADSDGFDELRVGLSNNVDFILGEIQAIAIDNLNVQTIQTTSGPAPVPEPATLLLFGTGLVGLARARFRRRK